jgi:hypothetical protein
MNIIEILILIGRYLLGFFSIALFYVAFFLYENEEGKIQNKIKEWWTNISDKEKIFNNNFLEFFRNCYFVLNNKFNTLFGIKFISRQFFELSILLTIDSIAISICLFQILIMIMMWVISISKFDFSNFLLSFFPLPFICLFSIIGIIATRKILKYSPIKPISYLIFSALYLMISLSLINSNGIKNAVDPILWLPRMLIIGFLFNSISIIIVRWIAKIAKSTNCYKILISSILVNLLITVSIIVVHYPLIKSFITNPFSWFLSISNLPSLLISSAILVLSFTIIFSRFVGHFSPRILYALQRYKVIKRKKMLLTLSLSLASFSGLPLFDFVTKFIKSMIIAFGFD